MEPKQASQVTTGILLVALGLIFLAERLSLAPWLDFHRLWPVVLIVLGVGKLLEPRRDGRRGGGAWLVFLGGLFLLHTYDIMTLSQSWPLFIVAGGVSILLGRRRSDAAPVEPH
jgi:hypothetical protein